jgi:hypothetical protein
MAVNPGYRELPEAYIRCKYFAATDTPSAQFAPPFLFGKAG